MTFHGPALLALTDFLEMHAIRPRMTTLENADGLKIIPTRKVKKHISYLKYVRAVF